MKAKYVFYLAAALGLLLIAGVARLEPLTGEDVDWHTFSVGGARATSALYDHTGSLGQTTIGRSKSAHFNVNAGFIRPLDSIGLTCCILPGDANDDGAVNISDAIYLNNYWSGGGPPPPCLTAGDVNNDCRINVADVVFLVNYVFSKPGWQYPKCSPCM
jgi:hypothetical protein